MNLYNENFVFFEAGSFGRCPHGHTAFGDCFRCGIWHPIRCVRNFIWRKRNG